LWRFDLAVWDEAENRSRFEYYARWLQKTYFDCHFGH
jgi:hypothetical protein